MASDAERLEAWKADMRARLGPKLLALESALTDELARRRGLTYVELPGGMADQIAKDHGDGGRI